MIAITVSYATPKKQVEIALTVDDDCTVAQAIALSKITEQFSDGVLSDNRVGIFSKQVTLDTTLQAGDRVEIYRSLLIDPKEARMKRVDHSRIKIKDPF